MKAWWAVVRRDLMIAGRRLSDAVAVVMFFVLAVVLFPLGVGPDLEILQRIAPGIIWVAALLAAISSIFRPISSSIFKKSKLLLTVSRDVPPSLSFEFTSAPLEISNSALSLSALITALAKGVIPLAGE